MLRRSRARAAMRSSLLRSIHEATVGKLANSCGYSAGGRADGEALSVQPDSSPINGISPKDGASKFRSPRPHKPGKTKNFPRADIKRTLVENPASSDSLGA